MLKDFFKRKYRIEVSTYKGKTYYTPEQKKWHDLDYFPFTYYDGDEFGGEYEDYVFDTKEEAQAFISKKIAKRKPAEQPEVIGYFEYRTRSEKVKSVLDA